MSGSRPKRLSCFPGIVKLWGSPGRAGGLPNLLKLHEAVQRGEPCAVCVTLKCLGKDRGYVERQDRTRPTGQPLSGERHKTVIVAGGSKAEYIAKLNDAREMIRGAGKSASHDGAFGAGQGD